MENCPVDRKIDLDYVISLMDCEKKVDPHYAKHYARPPIPCPVTDPGYAERWIT